MLILQCSVAAVVFNCRLAVDGAVVDSRVVRKRIVRDGVSVKTDSAASMDVVGTSVALTDVP